MPKSEEVLTANDALRTAIKDHGVKVDNLTARIEEAETRGDRTRTIVYLLTVALFLGGGWVIWDRVQANSRYLKQQCAAGNESRQLENKLWTNLVTGDLALAEAEGYKPTQQELDVIATLRADVAAAYPQRDCGQVSKGKVVNVTPNPTGGPQ